MRQVQHVGQLPAGHRLRDAEQQRELVDRELRDLRGALPAVGPGLLGARQHPAVRVAALMDGLPVVQDRPLADQHQPPGRGGVLVGDLGDQRVSTPLPAHRLDPLRLHTPQPRGHHRRFRLADKAKPPTGGHADRVNFRLAARAARKVGTTIMRPTSAVSGRPSLV